nr:immunoglobulin light chain junction region [Mus musculus]NSL98219.1 immunoglobulin light chain junction region [Mus musculus]NSL99144.1 immunoglobulin light chain junction region [Mus musculus]NSL99376.1 immunoglobulin light chain junction region [Mus musculus]NSL99380.1 immunoglobulin light chain junction region [Mus musculus]
CLQFYEFPYTF